MKEMKEVWNGAAAVIIKENKILMVQHKESMNWSVPSGGIEYGENPEQACVREAWEETGYRIEVKSSVNIKKTSIQNFDVTTHYFLCATIGGELAYNDPDDAIEEVAWKTPTDLLSINLSYIEDREMLLSFLSATQL